MIDRAKQTVEVCGVCLQPLEMPCIHRLSLKPVANGYRHINANGPQTRVVTLEWLDLSWAKMGIYQPYQPPKPEEQPK